MGSEVNKLAQLSLIQHFPNSFLQGPGGNAGVVSAPAVVGSRELRKQASGYRGKSGKG